MNGGRLCASAAVIVLALVSAILAVYGTDAEGLRIAIRATATTSLLLFVPTFVASALNALRPSERTKWLLRHRRHLGLSFAESQAAHLALVVALASRAPDDFWARLATTTLVGGALGYVLVAAMAATSFDRAARWLGRARWKALHVTGMYALWGIFLFSYAGRVSSLRYPIFVVVLVAALVARIAARVRRRNARGSAHRASVVAEDA